MLTEEQLKRIGGKKVFIHQHFDDYCMVKGDDGDRQYFSKSGNWVGLYSVSTREVLFSSESEIHELIDKIYPKEDW